MPEPESQAIRVLVADDEEIVLSLVRDALEDEGYEVFTAADGGEALKLVQEYQPQLIITDIRMPRMDGIEMVRQAREIDPQVVVIFMTGYADLNSAKNAISQGAFEYILKPFELSEIRQAVTKASEKIRKEAAEKAPGEQLERLSDLSQMLYQAGDRKSLATLSLKFAMMHCQARLGTILHWDSDLTNFRLIKIIQDATEEVELPEEPIRSALSSVSTDRMNAPIQFESLHEHPLHQVHPDDGLGQYLIPPELSGCRSLIGVPIERAGNVFSLMTIGFGEDAKTLTDTDLKFISITASQLALSLENILLLEEAKQAYARLKELQDETIQLEKMATRGEMSAEIGHELNNFLGVVAGNLSLLDFNLKKGSYDKLPRYVEGIADNVEKVKKFTANLMDLTPIASTKEVLYLDELLEEVIDYLRPQKRYRGVTIELHPIEQKVPLEADNVHVQQLLYNLFNNAADATVDREERRIDVRVTTEPDKGVFHLAITDTGVGIEPALLQKAFNEKFTTKKTGHGFGLLVCRRVIESHQGQLHIDSTPNVGTTITITFPLAKADVGVQAPVEV